MVPSLTPSSLLPAKIGSPLQHSVLKLTCPETFLCLAQPGVVNALHSVLSYPGDFLVYLT